MKSLRKILSLPLLLLAFPMGAQDAFFHRGAQHFLSGSNQLAKAEVERGLKAFPEDASLKKFWELLNQQQDSNHKMDQDQKDKNDSQDKKDQQKQDKQDSQKDQNQKQQQKDKDSDKKDKGQQQKDDPNQEKKDQESAANKDKDKEKKDGKEGQAGQPQKGDEEQGDPEQQQVMAVRMTPQQAVRLLEGVKADEKTLQFKPVLRTNRTERLLKDW